MGFINWLLNQPCATNGCTERVSRWIDDEPKVVVHGVPRLLLSNMSKCPHCRKAAEKALNELDLEKAILLTSPLDA